MTATQKLENFLRPAILAIPGVNYTEFADGENIDRFTEDTVRRNTFPGVFVIAADYEIRNNGYGGITALFSVIFYFLEKKPDLVDTEGSYQDEELAFTAAELKSIELYKTLRHANHPTAIVFESNSTWKPQRIKNVTLDLALGYQVSTKIGIPVHDIFC